MPTPYLTSYTKSYSFARGATRIGDAAQAAENHRARALAEVDGLFAGFQYLEKADGHQTSRPLSSGIYVPDRASFDDFERDLNSTIPEPDLADDYTLHQSDSESQDSESQSSKCDWSSIKNVMEGSERHWRSFQQLAEKLKLPAINKIRNQYVNARGLREAGVFAFRETLSGEAPKDLKGVFAFASLSFVVSKLLYTSGRLDKHEILSGIKVWRDSIRDPEEKDVFLKLAEQLWPEAKAHLHFIPINQKHLGRFYEISSAENPYRQPEDQIVMESIECFRQDQQDHGRQTTSNVEMDASELFDCNTIDMSYIDQESSRQGFEPWNDFFMSEQVFKLTDQTRETWHWHDLLPLSDTSSSLVPANASYDNPRDIYRLGSGPEGRPPDLYNDPPGTVISVPTCKDLQETTVFQAISLYLLNFSRFFYLLSGGGLSAKTFQSINTFNNDKGDVKDHILDQYLEPLKKSEMALSSQSLAILAVAKKFVKLGRLQSVEEVQDYLITVGREILPVGKSFSQFSRWVYSLVDLDTDNNKPSGYSCEVCRKSYRNSSNLSRHRKIHKAPPQPCPARCGWTCNSGRADRIRSHLASKHPEWENAVQRLQNQ